MKQRKIASSLFISNFSQVLKITVNVFLIFLFVQENITAYIQHISRYLEMFLVFIADYSEDYLLWGIFEGKRCVDSLEDIYNFQHDMSFG